MGILRKGRGSVERERRGRGFVSALPVRSGAPRACCIEEDSLPDSALVADCQVGLAPCVFDDDVALLLDLAIWVVLVFPVGAVVGYLGLALFAGAVVVEGAAAVVFVVECELVLVNAVALEGCWCRGAAVTVVVAVARALDAAGD